MRHTETIRKRSKTLLVSLNEDPRLHWFILFGTILLIAVLLFPSLWRATPRYHVGDVVKQDIKSPKDFLIEDKEATERKREEAALSVLTIYDSHDTLASELAERVTHAFQHVRTLGQASPDEINPNIDGPKSQGDTETSQPGPAPSRHDLIWKEKQTVEDILGIRLSDKAYETLEKEGFAESISEEISRMFNSVFRHGIVGNKQLLVQQRHNGIIVRKLSSKKEYRESDLQKFYSLDEARIALANTGRTYLKDFDYRLRGVMIDLAQRLIQPNLTLNRGATEELRDKTVAEVKAVLTQIKKGEMLVREGEKLSPLHMARIQALESEMKRAPLFTITIGFMLLAASFLVISYTTNFKTDTGPVLTNKDLLFLCIMLVILFLLSKVSAYLVKGLASNIPYSTETASAFYAIPIASGAMTVCLFMGMGVALPFALTTAFITGFLFENQFEMFLFFLLSSMVGAYSVRNCRERGVLIKAGLKVALANVLVITSFHMFGGAGLDLKLVWDWAFGLFGGMSSGILTTGFAPVVEMTLAYTTDIKLLELSNLDRPILRKLMLEAPGTYHHSVIVGSLGEAAAAAIGANPLLAKVSGYYHDIGKIEKPLYFIENQGTGKNRHDKLAPSMSSLIITSHVRDGVETAKRNRLGKAIVDIIQQHHGTGLISYFYEKAKRLKGEGAVNVEHFRYPGPKPQTKEAGLVLLADSAEASSRSLENPTPARIKGLVQTIINNMLLDGQLDECELTLKDLNRIATIFNKILNGIYHNRIEYPNGSNGVATVDSATSKAHGNSDRRQTRSSRDRP